MYQWIKINIKSSVNFDEVIEWCDEIEQYGYALIYEKCLIYKKTANLDDFVKENLENILEMDYYEEKLLSKDDLIEYWMNGTSKEDVINELISGVVIEGLLEMDNKNLDKLLEIFDDDPFGILTVKEKKAVYVSKNSQLIESFNEINRFY